ncbi:hypothetical protein K2173_004692 [Erythroxylum novogranatense]|uniref:Uncharacterized protein n=1 Tax=Erythroxylum novogranatense TaxID=1862640 RepID=A0AAV8UC19_9ROSI|nr:hypothetical protein K2173_004692 [Erythroxylum novogranatense]
MKTQNEQQKRRLCDYCNKVIALLYCRADSAKLCLACDREVHSTNLLFSKHTRALLCDACDNAPASIFCETEQSAFCQNCNSKMHGLSSSSYSSWNNRRQIEGFTEYPSVSELMTVFGLENLGGKERFLLGEKSGGLGSELDGWGLADGYSHLLVWESLPCVSIDELIASCDSDQNFQASRAPDLSKNCNAACGQHREEIIRQLGELACLELKPSCENAVFERINVFQSPGNTHLSKGCDRDTLLFQFPDYEENACPWLNDVDEAVNTFISPASLKTNFEECCVVPQKQSDFGGTARNDNDGHEAQPQHPSMTTTLSFPRVTSHEINTQERDYAISRYNEKKKARRYDKQVRYESRKAHAEGRTRIRGRSTKTTHQGTGIRLVKTCVSLSTVKHLMKQDYCM